MYVSIQSPFLHENHLNFNNLNFQIHTKPNVSYTSLPQIHTQLYRYSVTEGTEVALSVEALPSGTITWISNLFFTNEKWDYIVIGVQNGSRRENVPSSLFAIIWLCLIKPRCQQLFTLLQHFGERAGQHLDSRREAFGSKYLKYEARKVVEYEGAGKPFTSPL